MKPQPVRKNGIQFRSKLEARWYLFMKRLQWNIEYEPQEIPKINGWIPDFIIIGKTKKILVDVKPIYSSEEWNSNHPDYNKILNSGIKNTEYELLILGASFDLGNSSFGILYEHLEYDNSVNKHFEESPAIFTEYVGNIGFLPETFNWVCRITNEYGKIYVYRGNKFYERLEEIWNECGSELQWNKDY